MKLENQMDLTYKIRSVEIFLLTISLIFTYKKQRRITEDYEIPQSKHWARRLGVFLSNYRKLGELAI